MSTEKPNHNFGILGIAHIDQFPSWDNVTLIIDSSRGLNMATFQLESLSKHHDLSTFDCGEPSLNGFLQKYVSQYERNDYARTQVAVRTGETAVVGYYSLATGGLNFSDLPDIIAKRLPKVPVPVVLLGRLAVDKSAQSQGLGSTLLKDAILKTLLVSKTVGIHAIFVQALHEQAAAFYQKYGFQPLPDQPLHLFQSIKSLRAAAL